MTVGMSVRFWICKHLYINIIQLIEACRALFLVVWSLLLLGSVWFPAEDMRGCVMHLSLCFRAISMLGTIRNALIHRSDLTTFISFTLATFQTCKYNIQPHIWTPEVITFFLAEMTLSAGSVSLQAKQTDYWVNRSPICKSQTFEFVLREKTAQTHLSQLLTHPCTDRACYLEVSHQLFLDFGLQENVWFHLWISTFGSPVPETFRAFPPEVVKNGWSNSGLSWIQFVCFTKTVFNDLSHNLYLMSFLTEHCSAVIIQGLFSTAIFEHLLHIFLFPG